MITSFLDLEWFFVVYLICVWLKKKAFCPTCSGIYRLSMVVLAVILCIPDFWLVATVWAEYTRKLSIQCLGQCFLGVLLLLSLFHDTRSPYNKCMLMQNDNLRNWHVNNFPVHLVLKVFILKKLCMFYLTFGTRNHWNEEQEADTSNGR